MTEEKKNSRKWIVCSWSMIMDTLLIIGSMVALIIGHEPPSWIGGVIITLTAIPAAYLGVNVYQKTHLPKTEEAEE